MGSGVLQQGILLIACKQARQEGANAACDGLVRNRIYFHNGMNEKGGGLAAAVRALQSVLPALPPADCLGRRTVGRQPAQIVSVEGAGRVWEKLWLAAAAFAVQQARHLVHIVLNRWVGGEGRRGKVLGGHVMKANWMPCLPPAKISTAAAGKLQGNHRHSQIQCRGMVAASARKDPSTAARARPRAAASMVVEPAAGAAGDELCALAAVGRAR